MLGVAVLVLVVVAIVVGIKIGLSLGISILLTSVGLGLYLGNLPTSFIAAITSEDAWVLILATYTIAVLSELYRVTGAIGELGRGLSSVGDPRIGLILIPAVVGLMPVAGGALLSAPLVEALGRPIGLSNEVLAYINLWYRHTLLYSYPFSQILIILSQLTKIQILGLAAATAPISLLMTFIGLPTLLRLGKTGRQEPRERSSKDLVALVPLAIAILLLMFLSQLMGSWAIPVGTSLAIITLMKLRGSKKHLAQSLFSRRVADVLLSVVAVILLREVINNSQLPAELSNVISSSGNSEIMFALMSSLISIATGSPMTGLFIVVPLLSSLGLNNLKTVILVHNYTFLGYIVSPTHLCLLYTAEYFKANLTSIYRYLIPSALAVIATVTIFYSFI